MRGLDVLQMRRVFAFGTVLFARETVPGVTGQEPMNPLSGGPAQLFACMANSFGTDAGGSDRGERGLRQKRDCQ